MSAAIDPLAPLWLSAVLLALGIIGVFVRRSLLTMAMSLQLMAAAAVLALVGFDAQHLSVAPSHAAPGQGLGVLILTVAAAQGMVALGLVIARQRIARRGRGRGVSPW
ncbi:MAG: NADH-quinone oxidoreductase subunit K [bacterium]|nr:NADH-quinone oxidoreductase subunit K [bacterium]